jgi:uncharacterized protein
MMIMNPCLIYVPGFQRFRDWGSFPYLGGYFSNLGFIVFTFNFSNNGVCESLTYFVEFEKFEKNTISLVVEELTEIISVCNQIFNKINLRNLELLDIVVMEAFQS